MSEHWSSPNGCHPDCPACGDEKNAEQHAYKRIARLHGIIERSLLCLNPPLDYRRTMKAIELLAKLVHEYEWDTGRLWSIGEFGHYSLDALIVGAYWFFSENYNGQWSDEYRTQCVIGKVFQPGMTSGPEPLSSEADVYAALKDISGYKVEDCS